ncbi:MAG: methionyl-tRNA formyltransferase [Selenomonadaceae bacterium]|nr:methionyl-tRNA formyltransferase [Selenomonadaceae bacterium]
MDKLRTIFMGTPEFAVPSLAALNDKVEIITVVTQPDRPRGRGHKLMPSPVKVWAVNHSIPELQPERIKNDEFIEQLENLKPDLIVVVAFGQILSQRILDLPKFGCINVHASLLPKYRGAAPIEWSLINGENKTGVTTMMMDIGLDTGDMLVKKEIAISEDTVLTELRSDLMELGAAALMETIDNLIAGTLQTEKQDDSQSNYAPMLNKETGLIDWNKSAREIHNLVRGLHGGAYTVIDEQKYKIWRTRINPECGIRDTELVSIGVGKFIKGGKNSLFVKTGDGVIEVLEIQAPNSKRLSAADYLRGHKIN